MGRAPMMLLFVLLVLALLPATALGVDGDDEVTFAIPLQTNNGLSAKLEADDDEIDLKVSNDRGQEATYFAEGKVTREGISVSFGPFGEFVVDYEPFRTLKTREPNRHCEGEPRTTSEGFFNGTLRFRGEHGYILIEASRAKGTLVLVPPWDCDYRGARASQAARGAEVDKATLVAQSRHKSIQFAAFGSRGGDEDPFTVFWATSQGVRQGIGISRFTATVARFAGPRAGFRFDNRLGTAFVDPPAPFAGSARYQRRPHGPDRWTGNLTAPLLGLGRVRLTGPGFRAGMAAELPSFE
jgi:hypothetical protein